MDSSGPVGLADKLVSPKEIWWRAFRLSDGCVTSADGDLTDEDAVDRYVNHRGGGCSNLSVRL